MEYRRQRLAIARLYIEIGRGLTAELGVGARYGERVELLPVACAVMVGHLTNSPMTASSIARYLDMPRTSVLRRLHVLQAGRVVMEKPRNRWCICEHKFDGKGQGTLSAIRVLKQIMRPLDEPVAVKPGPVIEQTYVG